MKYGIAAQGRRRALKRIQISGWNMAKPVLLKDGQKITEEELEDQGWLLLMTLPNGNQVFSRNEIKVIWSPQQEEVVHLFSTTDMYRLFKKTI
jgi:hypothetical protein